MRKYDLKPMEGFTMDVSPEEMAEVLDEVSFEYTLRFLYEDESCPPFNDAANNLYMLRKLRDAFRQMTVKEE